MGPTQRDDPRKQTLARMIHLLERAAECGANLVVFPELAFTTFFPRWLLEGDELDRHFERAMPNPAVQALFDRARELKVGFYVGYAEIRGATLQLLYPSSARWAGVGRYRKVHLPGSVEPPCCLT
jgi:predicted amidohydrolase